MLVLLSAKNGRDLGSKIAQLTFNAVCLKLKFANLVHLNFITIIWDLSSSAYLARYSLLLFESGRRSFNNGLFGESYTLIITVARVILISSWRWRHQPDIVRLSLVLIDLEIAEFRIIFGIQGNLLLHPINFGLFLR